MGWLTVLAGKYEEVEAGKAVALVYITNKRKSLSLKRKKVFSLKRKKSMSILSVGGDLTSDWLTKQCKFHNYPICIDIDCSGLQKTDYAAS